VVGCLWSQRALRADLSRALAQDARPAWRLPRRDTPLAWFTGTNDWFFWMPSLMKTHDMAGGPKHLSLVPNWDHALPTSVTEQTFIWLDAHLKERPDFVK
jgi:hypothetical protein